MIEFRAIRGWVFDIDDTLYLERDYVASGFTAVGRWMLETQGIRGFAEAAIARFESGARGNVFNLAMVDVGLPVRNDLVAEMVRQYRKHAPEIILTEDARELLTRLRGVRPMAVISDGPLDSQSRKSQALGLDSFAAPVVLTDRWGAGFGKPHERAFREVEYHFGFNGNSLVYVADNPAKDFWAPHALGWQTLRILRSGGQHTHMPTPEGVVGLEIESFSELIDSIELPVIRKEAV